MLTCLVNPIVLLTRADHSPLESVYWFVISALALLILGPIVSILPIISTIVIRWTKDRTLRKVLLAIAVGSALDYVRFASTFDLTGGNSTGPFFLAVYPLLHFWPGVAAVGAFLGGRRLLGRLRRPSTPTAP